MNIRHAILLALAVGGCRQQGTPLANPFLAPDRVPPPATRTPAPGTAVPYYGGGASAPPSSWRVGRDAAAAIDADGFADAPDADSAARGRTSWAALDPSEDRIAVPSDDAGERLTQAAARGDDSLSSRTPLSGDAFRRPRERNTSEHGGEVIQAGYDVVVPERAGKVSRGAQQPANRLRPRSARFDYDPDFRWLQGRLEHSQASGEWKLRYIPIDGATDEYGGSVILENPQALGDLSAGDFARIRGELRSSETDRTTFAPIYRIVETQAVAD